MPLSEMHSLCFLILNLMIESEETQVNGFIVVCDASSLSYKQLISVITNRELVLHIVHLIQVILYYYYRCKYINMILVLY